MPKGNRGKKGSIDTSVIIIKKPGTKRITCSNCIHYDEDKSCSKLGLPFSELGYDFWNQCEYFDLSEEFETTENLELVARVRDRKNSSYHLNKKDKKKGHIKSKNLTVKKIKKTKEPISKKVISRRTVQEMRKQNISYQAIADKFGVDSNLIRKIDMGFYGDGYKN